MFEFVKRPFVPKLMLFGCNLSSVILLDQEWKVSPVIIDVNSNKPACYSFSIKTSQRGGSCNNINYPYAKLCS